MLFFIKKLNSLRWLIVWFTVDKINRAVQEKITLHQLTLDCVSVSITFSCMITK
ncbi:hypothetical protein NCIMB2158_100034 [Tenacibaculum maritimum]|jgi:hypothetical protein|nr:hypothetical protein NCIMB2158_100034 [Tenacibaculum maritimum]